MKIIIGYLLICIGYLTYSNAYLQNRMNNRSSYRTNLTRDEMKEALSNAVSDSIALMIPGDPDVMPYLFKADKVGQYELVRR